MTRRRDTSEVGNGVVAAVCLAQILGMAGHSAVPALLSELMTQWSLSNAEGGWLAGVLFAGYVGSVLPLVALSDRVAARPLYLACAATGALANLAFVWTDSFAGALAIRVVAGIGLAGTYMPGLKALTDRLEGDRRARVVAWYTVSFTVGAGASFLLAGHLAAFAGWRAAFLIASLAGGCGFVLALRYLPAGRKAAVGARREPPWAFRQVLGNRPAMAFVLAYAAVVWASAGIRQWLVVFLNASTLAGGNTPIDVYLVAALANMAGVPAGLLGAELAIRAGMRRAAICIFVLGAAASPLVGAVLHAPEVVVAAVVLLYAFVVQGNVSSLTAGAVAAAQPGRVGATMALHSFVGFSGGMFGPLVMGLVLDGAGGTSHPGAWMLAYGSCGLACLAGAWSLRSLGRGR
jgi:MFS family permease